MRNLSRAIIGVVLLASFASGQKKSHEITITGEVVETQCYVTGLSGSGKGITHKECALTCAKNGIPLSILEDGTNQIFVAGQTKTAQSGVNKMLIDYVADKVKVTGRTFEKGGMKLILISRVERVTP